MCDKSTNVDCSYYRELVSTLSAKKLPAILALRAEPIEPLPVPPPPP